ncbi:zinc fingers and homeoboxes protein 2 [Microcaecilia unicolor]|uniref:Zinc fingers and homeoboxes protein 2 n=1 Tax=Microcaecilia unicolor TaxID=1415580 RepID=A0A6P7ZAB0_9AMPH|nr:zinc fingers and homeoboxes protein 2-like [Microcaecilia unicolor]
MASKRKSTTPCMVRSSEVIEQADTDEIETLKERSAGTPKQESKDDWETESSGKDCEVVEGKSTIENTSKKVQGGYECKYCPFSTKNLNEFTEHVDLQHPNVILNPLYVCAECNFTTKKYDSLSDHNTKYHPGENNFKLKLMKRNNQTVLEQSVDRTNNVVPMGNSSLEDGENDENLPAGITVTKTPIMKMGKTKVDGRKIPRMSEEVVMESQIDGSSCIITETTNTAITVNGTELLQDAVAHVMPSVQLPPNISLLPKVPVPLNSTKYNSALDVNETLINSFNKFPYPTQAELSWLTAASKHPEEQIRIWFATQRLKHGISWSPEEVEEARKKMFNGTIQPVPQTITVLPAPLATNSKVSQPIIQTAVPCQILGQTGLVLTQVANGSAVTCPSFTLSVAGSSNQGKKRPLQNHPVTSETKRPQMAQASPKLSHLVATSPNERKKTKEQIAILKSSFLKSQFPDDCEIYKLIDITGLSRSDIKKWFSDHRYRSQRGIVHITSESIAKDQLAIAAARSSARSYHPYPDFLPQKFKGKTEDQLKVLERCFAKNAFPIQMDVDKLRAETKLSRREIDLWFSERRKLRDNMEQAVLDSMDANTKKQGMQNGSITQIGQLNSSHVLDSLYDSSECHKINQEQLHLLKTIFARTQWPSPQEYDQLAAQTGLVRTEIVRWFKDNRCTLRTGSLKWMERYQKQYNHPTEQNQSKGLIKSPRSPKNGREAPKQYVLEHKELRNADLDKVVMKSKMSYEQKKDHYSAKQKDDSTDRSQSNSQDDQCSDENESGDVNWVDVTVGEEDTISNGTDSWSQTAQEGQTEVADYESESASGDNSHI